MQERAQAVIQEGGLIGETEEFFNMLLKRVVCLLKVEQVDSSKVIHRLKTNNKHWQNEK